MKLVIYYILKPLVFQGILCLLLLIVFFFVKIELNLQKGNTSEGKGSERGSEMV